PRCSSATWASKRPYTPRSSVREASRVAPDLLSRDRAAWLSGPDTWAQGPGDLLDKGANGPFRGGDALVSAEVSVCAGTRTCSGSAAGTSAALLVGQAQKAGAGV